jgi:hypothetical protein
VSAGRFARRRFQVSFQGHCGLRGVGDLRGAGNFGRWEVCAVREVLEIRGVRDL